MERWSNGVVEWWRNRLNGEGIPAIVLIVVLALVLDIKFQIEDEDEEESCGPTLTA